VTQYRGDTVQFTVHLRISGGAGNTLLRCGHGSAWSRGLRGTAKVRRARNGAPPTSPLLFYPLRFAGANCKAEDRTG
jgi:hypothetical protein